LGNFYRFYDKAHGFDGVKVLWYCTDGNTFLQRFRALFHRKREKSAALCSAPRLSKKWLAPLFRGFHSSLAPTARPGSYVGKPLLRKPFCGFAVHAAKSDESLKGLRSSIRQRFLDKLRALHYAALL